MENDRISYTYSEKIGGANYSSKSISVSLTTDVPDGVPWESVRDKIMEFVEESVEQKKAALCQPKPQPAAPMPTQPIPPTQPFPTPGIPAVPSQAPTQEPYVPVAKGGEYVLKFGKYKGQTVAYIHSLDELTGYLQYCREKVAEQPQNPKMRGMAFFVGQADAFLATQTPAPTVNAGEEIPF